MYYLCIIFYIKKNVYSPQKKGFWKSEQHRSIENVKNGSKERNWVRDKNHMNTFTCKIQYI